MMPSISSSFSSVKPPGFSSLTDRAAQLLSNISTTFDDTRNAIVRKVINGHQFEATLLKEPTKCSHCDELIWIGLPPGQKCKLCRLSSHSRCINKIVTRCVMSNFDEESSWNQESLEPPPEHKFLETKTFMSFSPTMCHHCGTLLIVSRPYDECANCSRLYHHDCLRYARECHPRRIKSSENDAKQERQYDHTSKLSIKHFEIRGLLGQGTFGKVWLATLKDTKGGSEQNKYAIKVINKTNALMVSDPESVFTEWRALNCGRSYPFLTVAHGCFQTRERLYFVMEYVEGKHLLYYLDEEEDGAFSEERARFYAAEITLALMFLHRQQIIYRDIKLNNIMLDPFGHCKLFDFGMAKILGPQRAKTRTFCGTPHCISPEILRGQSYDYSVDWWSLGVVLYEMLNGEPPFTGCCSDELFDEINNKELDFNSCHLTKRGTRLSDRARSVLDGLLTKEPRDRLGCQLMEGCETAIKEHPFFLFKTNNQRGEAHLWEELEAKQITPPYIPPRTREQHKLIDRTFRFTPITSDQLKEVDQSKFEEFSNYSESLLETLNQSIETS